MTLIDNVDFHALSVQKYWAPPSSWSQERKYTETRNAILSGDYVGARKMDGAFYKFVKYMDGTMELLGRSKSVSGDYLNKIDWVPQLHSFFNALPNGTCLLGEIYFPNNEGSNHVTTIMGCKQDKAVQRQETNNNWLHYYIFDILAFDGKSYLGYTMDERVEKLTLCQRAYGQEFHEWAEYFEGKDLWDRLQVILADGGEGVVITKRDSLYQPDKRPARQTFKVKRELQDTLDVVIIDANPPTRLYSGIDIMNWQYWENVRTGELLQGTHYKEYSDGAPIEPVTKNYFNHWAGSLVIAAYNPDRDKFIVVGSLSGLTEEILANWKSYRGRVIEVTGMQLMTDSNGNFTGIRHPKFVQFRDDKRPTDCLMDQFT